MRRVAGDRLLRILQRFLKALAGQGVHQVQIDIVKRVLRRLDGAPRFMVVVNTAQRFEMAGVETLDPDRQAGHTGIPKGAKLFSFKRSRIRLKRYFAISRQGQQRPDPGKNPANRRSGKQAWRSAADKNTVDAAPPDQWQRNFQIAKQSRAILGLRHRVLLLV